MVDSGGSFARRSPKDANVLNVAIWVLQIGLAGYYVIYSAIPLYEGGAYIRETFERIGIGQWFRHFTATVEVAGAIGLLIPPLCGLAALGLVGVMIGAITTELSVRTPDGAVLPAILLVLCAVVAYYRWPQTVELVRRFLPSRKR